jgi:hypothetical protein
MSTPRGRSRVVFVSTVTPGESPVSALLLAESIRAFAGQLAKAPIQLYVTPEGRIPEAAEKRLRALGVELIPVKVDEHAAGFFFMPEAHAAAEAESRLEGKAETLVWMSPNTLVLHEPRELALPKGKSLAYRPVHITNIGSKLGTPLDPFWTLIYRHCGVDEGRIFPVKTHVDGNNLRAYINAGQLAVRPEAHILGTWLRKFRELYMHPDFTPFYAEGRYRIFMHQAVLSAVAVINIQMEELLELPPTYNYPIHLYNEDKTGRRPARIDDLVTVRHEGFYDEPDWEKKMPAGDELKTWLSEKMKSIR